MDQRIDFMPPTQSARRTEQHDDWESSVSDRKQEREMIGILGRSSTEGTMRWLMLSLSGREWRVAIRLDESGMDKESRVSC